MDARCHAKIWKLFTPEKENWTPLSKTFKTKGKQYLLSVRTDKGCEMFDFSTNESFLGIYKCYGNFWRTHKAQNNIVFVKVVTPAIYERNA